MSYQVVAPLVLARDKEGRSHERYSGSVIDWLSPEQERHFLDSGLVTEIGAGVTGGTADDAVDGQPKRTAKTEDWVEYAVRVHGADPDEAKELSRQDLIGLYGS